MRSTMIAMALGASIAMGCSCSETEEADASTVDIDGAVDADGGVGADGAVGADGGMDAAAPRDGGSADALVPLDGAGGDGAVAGDAGPACARGFTFCGGECIFTAADPRNCGGCGVACGAGEACVASGCTDTCPAPLTLCGDRCVDLRSDSDHCDACDSPCAAGTGCSDGSCVDTIPVGPGPTDCADGRPLDLFTPDGDRCSGRIAAVSFTHALCACHDIGRLSAPALFDAFDSTRGPYAPGARGGSVGANGTVSSSSRFDATGDVRVAGEAGFAAGSGRYTINQALHVGTSFEGRGNTAVDGDGYIGGPFGAGGATFGGDLHTPSCTAVPTDVVAASCIEEPVSVPPPCACEPADVLPIGAMIDHYADPSNNDDAAIGLSPDALAAPDGPVRLDLPCGRYYLTSIEASRPVTIAIHGNAALFIGGDVDVSAALLLTVDPGHTLDVFIGGQLTDSGSLSVGSPAYPTATRFYVDGPCHHEGAACADGAECCGGACSDGLCGPDPARAPDPAVRISVRADMNGLFYAANGPVEFSAPLEMYGAVFTYAYDSSSDTIIHYDLQATRLADDCPTPPGPTPMPDAGVPSDGGATDGGSPDGGPRCGSCRDCDNQACIDGECGDCRTDSDCCSPLYCIAGRCIAAPF